MIWQSRVSSTSCPLRKRFFLPWGCSCPRPTGAALAQPRNTRAMPDQSRCPRRRRRGVQPRPQARCRIPLSACSRAMFASDDVCQLSLEALEDVTGLSRRQHPDGPACPPQRQASSRRRTRGTAGTPTATASCCRRGTAHDDRRFPTCCRPCPASPRWPAPTPPGRSGPDRTTSARPLRRHAQEGRRAPLAPRPRLRPRHAPARAPRRRCRPHRRSRCCTR